MGYLLSKPDDWQIRLADLIAQGPSGEFVISRILKELEAHGYLKRQRVRSDKGEFEWVSIVYETPITIVQLSTDGSSTDGKLHDITSTELTINTLSNTIPQELTDGNSAYKERLLKAMAKGIQGDAGIKQAIQTEFNLNPRWKNKDWQECVQFLKERKDGETVEKFATWWRTKDWRGKDGQPPTAKQIMELWPQAFKPNKKEKPEVFWVDH